MSVLNGHQRLLFDWMLGPITLTSIVRANRFIKRKLAFVSLFLKKLYLLPKQTKNVMGDFNIDVQLS